MAISVLLPGSISWCNGRGFLIEILSYCLYDDPPAHGRHYNKCIYGPHVVFSSTERESPEEQKGLRTVGLNLCNND